MGVVGGWVGVGGEGVMEFWCGWSVRGGGGGGILVEKKGHVPEFMNGP